MTQKSTHPKKKLRQVLHSIHPLSYRIKLKTVDKSTMEKKLFIEIISQLRKIEDRRDFMSTEIGMDMTTYEDDFFAVKEQLALIQMYLYQLVPDKDWDGTITIEHKKKEKIVPFKQPIDVWDVISKYSD